MTLDVLSQMSIINQGDIIDLLRAKDIKTNRKQSVEVIGKLTSYMVAFNEIPRDLLPRFGDFSRVSKYFSYSLDVEDGSSDLFMCPGMWVELPSLGGEKQVLYYGLTRPHREYSQWVIVEYCFDVALDRPVSMRAEPVWLAKLIDDLDLDPMDIIYEMSNFYTNIVNKLSDIMRPLEKLAYSCGDIVNLANMFRAIEQG